MADNNNNIDYGVLGPDGKKHAKFFFTLGILGALGLRIVLILNHYNQLWGIAVWYAAILCYLIFYAHRLHVENKRKKLIETCGLIEKLKTDTLSRQDKDDILKILNSLYISRLDLNFLIYMIMTVVALVAEIVLDISKIK